jgi:hypothetical protein
LFDQFFLIGADPLTLSPPPIPTILMSYPASNSFLTCEEISELPFFCFPFTFSPITANREKFLQQFIFEIGGNSNPFRIFGICTITLFPNTWFNSLSTKDYPICLCFLTRTPLIATSFHILYFLAKFLSGSVSTITPTIELQCSAQQMIFREIPNSFLQELCYFRRITPHDSKISLALGHKSVMTIPSLFQASNAIFYASLDLLFSSLSVENVMHALSLLLLERQVVILCSDVHQLTLGALCLRELLRPFRWRGAFLPLLPDRDKFRAILEAPMPYVVGVLKSTKTIKIPEYAVMIDLDNDTLIDPEMSPLMPGAKGIVEGLRKRIQGAELPPMWGNGRNPRYAQIVREKKCEFASWHSYVLCERKFLFTENQVDEIADFCTKMMAPQLAVRTELFFVTDRTFQCSPVTIFNRRLFLESLEGVDAVFCTAFCQTMMFQEFVDKQTDEKSRRLMDDQFHD